MTWLGVVVLTLILLAALGGMWWGWNRRAARTAVVVPPPPSVPQDALGASRSAPVDATYVSTTLADAPLERVVAHGLGVRSTATVVVHDSGVLVRRDGAPDLFVPRAQLVAAGTSAGMAGKFVGGQGLVVLRWRAAPTGAPDAVGVELETGLRTRRRVDHDLLLDALGALVGASPTSLPTPTTPATPATEEPS